MSANSLSESRMLKLMAYADGELEGAERAEVEAWLATDVDAVRFTSEVANLGDLVKTGHSASVDARAARDFEIADAVMAAVEKEKKPAVRETAKETRTAAAVVSLDAARARSRKKVGAMAVAALALAASVFVMTRTKEEAPMARAPVPHTDPAPNASAEPGVDVDLVETAGDSVRVFYLSNESSPTTSVVVWVDESGGK